ncbi:MAG: hypothetical protein Q8L37_05630 [Candidatus Gottesmanbacteria bacterium]|nr:hypothetical protein [Candidatus Gottesmanbacteria bacterium]
MSEEQNEAQERERITTIGLEHIRNALGYDEGKLTIGTAQGKELAYQMGLIVCVGIDDSEALMRQEADMLNHARGLIALNREKTVSHQMESGP